MSVDAEQIFSRNHSIDLFEVLTMNVNSDCTNLCFSNLCLNVETKNRKLIKVYQLESAITLQYTCSADILTLVWDLNDPRILVAQTENGILFFFIIEGQILLKDAEPVKYTTLCSNLSSVAVPFIIFVSSEPDAKVSRFQVEIIKEFNGTENEDPHMIRLITNFCIDLNMGNDDEAIKHIRSVKNLHVWKNAAERCLKLRRIKLVKLCMGKLKNVKALRTLRDVPEGDTDNIMAQMALHFGMNDEAKEILLKSDNFQSLNEYYQSCSQWDSALEIAASKNRLALPLTYFNFADHLRSMGDQNGAIASMEKSNISRIQIARMIMNEKADLTSYIEDSNDPAIITWGARNAESHGDFETAIKYYEKNNDIGSIVRVHYLSGDRKKAVALAEIYPNNLLASHYLANTFEDERMIPEAIKYYTRAKSFGSAIKLAKEHELYQELMQLALQSSHRHMNDVAKYFETCGILEKSITLYAKSGNIDRALELSYTTNDVAQVEMIAGLLDPSTHRFQVEAAAEFLSKNNSHETALKLLMDSQNYDEVLVLFETEKVILSESIIDKLDFSQGKYPPEKIKIIRCRFADLFAAQGIYSAASKLYALSGDRLKAMNCLLKSGDKDRIITFANLVKNSEIYITAANYLQSLDWRTDITILKIIVQFYTKVFMGN